MMIVTVKLEWNSSVFDIRKWIKIYSIALIDNFLKIIIILRRWNRLDQFNFLV